MKSRLDLFDSFCAPAMERTTAMWLDRVVFVFLVMTVLAAPFSIAATQTAWLTGMFLWLVRIFVRPRPSLRFGPLDIALWALFVWSAVSSAFSYAPQISFDRLRGAALFLIFYFVYHNIRSRRAAYLLAFALVFSGATVAAWTPVQKWLGRGVEIHGLRPESVLANAGIEDGFTLLRANRTKIVAPDDLIAQIERNETTRLEYYRPDFEFDTTIKRADLPQSGAAAQRLGIDDWKTGTVPRATGFFGHWTTLSEVMQLIASLTLGVFAAGIVNKRKRNSGSPPRVLTSLLMLFALALMCGALLLTITRASQLGFMVSAFVMLVLSGNRKLLLGAAVMTLPIALGGLLFLQQSRQIGVADPNDPSTQYRATMWRDGYRLWTASPRNFVFGIGMDSTKKHWQEWGMFDGGRLPIGHFHSTPVQLAVERGLPALILWLTVLGVYIRSLWRALRQEREFAAANSNWRTRGILLGCFGGAIGFFVGGIAHYNLGDAEVAMVFFILMGLGMRLASMPGEPTAVADEHAVADELRLAA